MKIEYLSLLWSACACKGYGYLSFSEKKKFPKTLWKKLENSGVVGKPTIPSEAFLEEYGFNEPARIRKIEKSDECWIIPQDSDSGGKIRIKMEEVQQYSVYLKDLVEYLTKIWGIETGYQLKESEWCRLGMIDRDIPLIFLYKDFDFRTIDIAVLKFEFKAEKICFVKFTGELIEKAIHDQFKDNGIYIIDINELLDQKGNLRWKPRSMIQKIRIPSDIPFHYDQNKKEFYYEKRRIKLSPKEATLFLKLLENSSTILSYAELNRALRDKPKVEYTPNNSNTLLKDRIYRIRQALPPKAAKWLINKSGGYGIIRPESTLKTSTKKRPE